jgi:flagellar biosynthesis protein FlhF
VNIRRFVAADMREALGAVRANLGADAVMLSSRKLPNGVEVIAAIDYDDSLFAAVGDQPTANEGRESGVGVDFRPAPDQPAARQSDRTGVRPGSDTGPTPFWQTGDDDADHGYDDNDAAELAEYEQLANRIAAAAEAERDTAAAAATAPAAAAPAVDATAAISDEIKDLKRLLETQLASLAWNDLNRRAPVRARLLRELRKLGVDASLATELTKDIPAEVDSREGMRALVRTLGDRLPLMQWDMAERGGIFAVVGPTGVGKTTSIAKIAARFVLRHSVADLGLVSTDTYRIGARQQLFNFARILRAPMQVADTATELERVLDNFASKKLVLIDTAGMSQRDVRLTSQFATLKVAGHRIQTVLALSAGADRACLEEALKVFRAASPEALIVTKLDEAAALGPVLSLVIRSRLPVAYLSDGQRVPEDLHLAAPKRFWLLHSAVKLTLDPALMPDETELAASYGELELAANA